MSNEADTLGLMAGVAFVAHCLLNQNAKVYGGARCPGIYSPLVDVLRADGWRIEQMPCPELAFGGLNRFWAVREQYDTAAFRRHCQRLVAAVAGAIELHQRAGRDVVLVGLEGSPSMGVCITSTDPERAGRPQWPEGTDELSLGQGIFVEELLAALEARGITQPRLTGITHQLPGHDEAAERTRLQAFLKN
jgi:predicted secreted protein